MPTKERCCFFRTCSFGSLNKIKSYSTCRSQNIKIIVFPFPYLKKQNILVSVLYDYLLPVTITVINIKINIDL